VKPLYLLFALLLALVLFFGTAGCEDPAETEARSQEKTQAEEPAPATPDRAEPGPKTEPAPEIPDPVNQD